MALREILARFGFQVDKRGLATANKGISGIVSKLGALGVVVGGTAIVRGISNFVTGIVDAGDALGKTATQLGLSSTELQSWQAAAGFAGVQGEKFNQSLRILAKNANAANTDNKGLAKRFDNLGISITGANGELKSSHELMRDTGLALGKLENRTEAVALAQELMGRTGAALLPLFKDGEEGLDAALEALERFGGGLSSDLIPLAEAAQDRFAEFGIATTSLKSRLAVALLPILNQVVLGLSKLFAAFSKAVEGTNLLQATLIVLGAALVKLAIAKFGSNLLALGRAALVPLIKIALLVLLVDDLITLFKGGKSVIGEFIDKLFGKGSAKAVVDAVKAVWEGVKEAATSGDFEKLDKALADIFGPPGQDLVKFVMEDLPEAFDFLLEDITAVAEDIVQAIEDWITGAGEAIADGATDFAEGAADLATAFIDGLVQGIKDGIKTVTDSVADVARAAIDAAKAIIKPGSPSKTARKEVAKPLAEGLFDIREATEAATNFARVAKLAMPSPPTSVSAPRGGGAGAMPKGGVIFQSKMDLSVSGGSPSDPQIQKLRQGVRTELTDNRRATLVALDQVVESPT